MLVNSSDLRAADFPLTEVRPLQLDVVDRGGRRTRGVEAFPEAISLLISSTSAVNTGRNTTVALFGAGGDCCCVCIVKEICWSS
jgi:hypothetical protein